MKEFKQVILVRKDLNMSTGKTAAQVAHASLGVLTNSMHTDDVNHYEFKSYEAATKFTVWLNGSFTKIILGVESEAQLLYFTSEAKRLGMLHTLITDEGRTEFKGKLTHTCLAIGPEQSDVIDKLTGKLSLLK